MDNLLFLQNIRRILKEKGISTSQVEQALGWSPGLISRWGKTCPSFDKVIALVEYLGISYESLLEGRGKLEERQMEARMTEKLAGLTAARRIKWVPCAKDKLLSWPMKRLESEDCIPETAYDFAYDGGYFILVLADDGHSPLSLRLYALADQDSAPVLAVSDTGDLGKILVQIDLELYTSWNQSKTKQFIQRFMTDEL